MDTKPKFDKINVAKMVARHLVTATVATFVTKNLKEIAPATEKLKTAELVGGIAGWYAGEKAEPLTDGLVDNLFAKIADRKLKNQITA